MERNKKKTTTLYLALTALFSALVFIVTFVLPVPVGVVGYVNFGDAIIFIASIFLGPIGGTIAGAVGSVLADVFLGYAVYAPFTAVIKGVEGLICGFVYCHVFRKKNRLAKRLTSMILASVWTIFGYFVADCILYGAYIGLFNSLFTLLQVVVSMVIALIVLPKAPDIFEQFRDKLFVKENVISVKAEEIENKDDKQ